MSLRELKNHREGWGMRLPFTKKRHFFPKNSSKSSCGKIKLTERELQRVIYVTKDTIFQNKLCPTCLSASEKIKNKLN